MGVMDKVLAVERTTELLGECVHLPLLAHAVAGDAEGLEALQAIVRRCVHNDEPLVVKPRHGANSALVFAWPNPRKVGEAAIMESVDAALNVHDKSWDKLDWQA